MNLIQTGFGQDISFSMRTFWFNAQTSSSTGQDQTVECNLRLDPVASVSLSQPDDCTCYTQADCAAPGKTRFIIIIGNVPQTLRLKVAVAEIVHLARCNIFYVAERSISYLRITQNLEFIFISVFSTWSNWSSCSMTCGSGEQTRTRTCDQNCANVSSDDLSQTQSCNDADCPTG